MCTPAPRRTSGTTTTTTPSILPRPYLPRGARGTSRFALDPYGSLLRTLDRLKSLRTRLDDHIREEGWRRGKARSRRVESWFEEVAMFQLLVHHLPTDAYQRRFSVVEYLSQKAVREACGVLGELRRAGKALLEQGGLMYRAVVLAPYAQHMLSRSARKAAATVEELFDEGVEEERKQQGSWRATKTTVKDGWGKLDQHAAAIGVWA